MSDRHDLRVGRHGDYAAILCGEGVDRVIEYGVAFYKKRCRAVTGT